MIIPNVSRHTLAQLNEQFTRAAADENRELRSNGGCGLKLKKEGEQRGFGFGRAAHRAAAWNRFERVIYNSFAPAGAECDASAFLLAKQMARSLRGGDDPQRPLRLRHVSEAARFAASFRDPAGKAEVARERWLRRHEAGTQTRAQAIARSMARGAGAGSARTPHSPEAARILAVCEKTVGNEAQARDTAPAGLAPGPHRPAGPDSPQAELMLRWCDRVGLQHDASRRTLLHPAPSEDCPWAPAGTA